MGKAVEVRLENIYCVSAGPDPGNNLELFGKLWVKVNTTQPNGITIEKSTAMLWDVQPYFTIGTNTFMGGGPPKNVAMENFDWLLIGGYMKDEDDGFWDPNDELRPDRFIQVAASDIHPGLSFYKITFDESGQRVEANFTLREIASW